MMLHCNMKFATRAAAIWPSKEIAKMTTETWNSQVQQATDFWKRLMEEQLAVVEQTSRLMKDNLQHAVELNAECRRFGLEATRKVTELIVGKA